MQIWIHLKGIHECIHEHSIKKVAFSYNSAQDCTEVMPL